MPSTTPELRAKFPDGDYEALQVLDKNFVVPKGFIIAPKVKGYKPTQREDEALDYLFEEWDYGYEPTTLEERKVKRGV